MRYAEHYDRLIQRARTRPPIEGYFELHHVIPKCLGGSDEESNLVGLTAQEHFVAHQLLVKMYPANNRLIYGAQMMCRNPHGGRVNNKFYGWLKNRLSVIQSKKFKGRVWSEEQNASRAEKVKAQWADPEFRAKRIASMIGWKRTAESRAKQSARMIGKPGRVWTPEEKAKVSATKQRISAKNKLLKGAEV